MDTARHWPDTQAPAEDFGRFLLENGTISAAQLMSARAVQANSQSSVDRILIAEGAVSPEDIAVAIAQFHGLRQIDLRLEPPDRSLCEVLPLRLCLNHSVIPWRRDGDVILIAVSRIEDFATALAILGNDAPAAKAVIATKSDIHAALAKSHRATLTPQASARVPAPESCRNWGAVGNRRLILPLGLIAVLMTLTAVYPRLIFAFLAAWASITLFIAAGFKIAAYIAHLSRPSPSDPPDNHRAETPTEPSYEDGLEVELPRVSVLVPLFKESEIAKSLLKRLSRLTYPKPLLDVVLVLEENDHLTRDTIAASDLPPWIRVIEVPDDKLKTKPRAMNYALDFCDGEIIGIWDAEDAPAPDQITTVVEEFHQAADDVVCLQGVLDYYNSRQNWLARCFTVEYAAWFRVVLPGMARLGFSIPLGGTTLFFRRDVLEEIGGWDAHNVTEDADLGFRLARHGYRTKVIPTVTGEEANCHFWPWIRQRSRWLKGYMITYLVHMRRPLRLYRQLGSLKFWGFQAHFVTALSQFMLAPVLWSFWLVLLGLPHPLDPLVGREIMLALGLSFLTVEVVNVLVNATAVSGEDHRHLLPWVPTLHFYYPLGAIAAYKALWELVFQPFYWDKTQHGHSLKPRKRSLFSSRHSSGGALNPPHQASNE
ncbi:glycosyltransferase [Rhodalgimonas zhirmunskyi]|uniref:Glycosyltransferase n=1 Tax=Rhodalgimonas zhirmunskyi TaxID=2964767 RepID=A0AAJ1U5P1_9RHOB|nr:glycosyltransferase [Rhodoalgimonas zhirmunskyi]MDQ2093494.1 glycosyltransferase [Rhodoalgimonas zhirmunskyi]